MLADVFSDLVNSVFNFLWMKNILSSCVWKLPSFCRVGHSVALYLFRLVFVFICFMTYYVWGECNTGDTWMNDIQFFLLFSKVLRYFICFWSAETVLRVSNVNNLNFLVEILDRFRSLLNLLLFIFVVWREMCSTSI